MPELKRTFTGGKMNKDADERIVPRGEYKEALNIEVATSEDSDVGAAQNILGNVQQTSAVSGKDYKYNKYNKHIAHVIDPATDNVYRFISTKANFGKNRPFVPPNYPIWMDRIVEFNTITQVEKAVLIDIYRVTCHINSASINPCDHDVTINVTGPIYQLRWGMQITIDGVVTVDDDVYVKDIDFPNAVKIASGIWSVNMRLNVLKDPLFSSITPTTRISFHGDRVLNFSRDRSITGLNIIDGMLFWTDDYSEPKKINIERSKQGSTTHPDNTWRVSNDQYIIDYGFDYNDFEQHTSLVVNEEIPFDAIIDNSLCDGSVIPIIPVSYDCDGAGNCYDPGTGSGAHTNITDCVIACQQFPPTWDCAPTGPLQVAGVYVEENNQGTGQFSTIKDAEDNCGSWKCLCPDPGNANTLVQTPPAGLTPGCYTYGQIFGTQYNPAGFMSTFPNPPTTTHPTFGVGLATYHYELGLPIGSAHINPGLCDATCHNHGYSGGSSSWNVNNPTNHC